MSLDPPAKDSLPFAGGGFSGANDDARPGPPPLVGPRADATAVWGGQSGASSPAPLGPPSEDPPPFLPGAMEVASPPLERPATPLSESAEASWSERLRRYTIRLIATCLAWCREDGYWYLSSMAFHALLIMALAMISLAIPRALLHSSTEKAPTFDSPKTDNTPPAQIERFVVGDAPLEPSELSPETLEKFQPEPIGGQDAKHYDDSPDFQEGGGIESVMNVPRTFGLGGLNAVGPGPGGKGGVGSSAGWGKNAGAGGDGTGFWGRGNRPALAGSGGGTRATERAVAGALNWLARHQTPHGKWSLDYRGQCKGGACSGAGSVQSDSAATALALLPFLAAGQTHKNKGIYKETVAKGLAWLVKQQRADGDLAGKAPQPMYSHGIATLALCEAYGMTHDESMGSAARRAVAYIERAQNESTGGWRYEPGETGDTSVFGWQIMALKSAQLAGLPVNSMVFENSKKWLHSVAKGEHSGLYSYQPYREVTPTMTAVGTLCRQYLGIDPKDPSILEGKRCLLENLPDGNLGRNSYYWYYATLAMHNFSGPDWDVWNRRMRRVLIESQQKEGCATGSWDPDRPTADAWGPQGGRLMLTSLNALTLEVYYRYLPLFKTDSLVPNRGQRMGFTKPIDSKEE